MHPTSYTIPGPAPYVVTNTGGGRRVLVDYPMKYPICPISNADWCSTPVSSFKDEASCWAVCLISVSLIYFLLITSKSSGEAWKQLATCYNTAPATGNTGCKKYEVTCNAYQAYCRECSSAHNCAGSFPGQPSKLRRQARAAHRHPLLPPIRKGTVLETINVVASRNENKLMNAHKLCEQITAKCKEDRIGGLCKMFGAACKVAVQPDVIEQFSEKGKSKWQVL